MDREEKEIFWNKYEQLSTEAKLRYLEARFGEFLDDVLRDYDFSKEIKYLKETNNTKVKRFDWW